MKCFSAIEHLKELIEKFHLNLKVDDFKIVKEGYSNLTFYSAKSNSYLKVSLPILDERFEDLKPILYHEKVSKKDYEILAKALNYKMKILVDTDELRIEEIEKLDIDETFNLKDITHEEIKSLMKTIKEFSSIDLEDTKVLSVDEMIQKFKKIYDNYYKNSDLFKTTQEKLFKLLNEYNKYKFNTFQGTKSNDLSTIHFDLVIGNILKSRTTNTFHIIDFDYIYKGNSILMLASLIEETQFNAETENLIIKEFFDTFYSENSNFCNDFQQKYKKEYFLKLDYLWSLWAANLLVYYNELNDKEKVDNLIQIIDDKFNSFLKHLIS